MNGPIPAHETKKLRAAVLDHYDRAARDLPWRRDTDPYRVLVSEVMLQQTRVETVKRFYGPWLERFPTVSDLALAEEDDVLKRWEGLGYYRRARNLHGAAKVVREYHDGVLPEEYEQLLKLPGVGEYTAGAVASIAFNQAVPAVDGNVRRVLSRLFDVAEPKARWLRDVAASLVENSRPGDWNQAVMELGATICTPRTPKCGACPVAGWCAALAAGTVPDRPAKTKGRAIPEATFVLTVVHRDERVLLVKRPDDGLLASMWAFPEAIPPANCGADTPALGLSIAESFGLAPVSTPVPLPSVRHRFTHLDAHYLPFSVEVAGSAALDSERHRWIDPRVEGELALPVAQRRVLESWLASRSLEVV